MEESVTDKEILECSCMHMKMIQENGNLDTQKREGGLQEKRP